MTFVIKRQVPDLGGQGIDKFPGKPVVQEPGYLDIFMGVFPYLRLMLHDPVAFAQGMILFENIPQSRYHISQPQHTDPA
jgi:hypothetical protein